MFTYDLPCGSSPYINWLYGTVQCHNVYVRITVWEFPLHKLTIRYNGTMFTYDLPCGSSPYINWLYGTMPQCLRTIYHAVVPLTLTIRYNAIMFTYDLPCGSSPSHKLTIRYNATMFTYDLPCGSSPYINWLYGTMHNVYVRFTMREFPLHKLTIRYNATMFTYDLPCGSSPYINWLYGTMAQCLRTIYHAGVPLT